MILRYRKKGGVGRQMKRELEKMEEKAMEHKKVYCNLCGKEMIVDQVVSKQDYVFIQKDWGYFSAKDGESHTIRICEACYDRWITSFKIPVIRRKQTELL